MPTTGSIGRRRAAYPRKPCCAVPGPLHRPRWLTGVGISVIAARLPRPWQPQITPSKAPPESGHSWCVPRIATPVPFQRRTARPECDGSARTRGTMTVIPGRHSRLSPHSSARILLRGTPRQYRRPSGAATTTCGLRWMTAWRTRVTFPQRLWSRGTAPPDEGLSRRRGKDGGPPKVGVDSPTAGRPWMRWLCRIRVRGPKFAWSDARMSGPPARVYIVDDDPQLRDGIALWLTDAGYQALAFPSGEALLVAYPQLPPGCIVVDMVMPSMSGLELQRRLITAGCRWPVIMLTGHATRPVLARAMEA